MKNLSQTALARNKEEKSLFKHLDKSSNCHFILTNEENYEMAVNHFQFKPFRANIHVPVVSQSLDAGYSIVSLFCSLLLKSHS